VCQSGKCSKSGQCTNDCTSEGHACGDGCCIKLTCQPVTCQKCLQKYIPTQDPSWCCSGTATGGSPALCN
jgi:hypothetical protein